MAEAQFAPIHTVDQETGFLESKAYLTAFDAQRKRKFIDLFRTNGLGLYRTAAALGLSVHTINKHYQLDPVFRKEFDEAKVEYADELEAVSRSNALNPKSVIERIFQLKALLPERYADQKNTGAINVTIAVDPSLLQNTAKRQDVLEVEEIKSDENNKT